MEIFSLDIFLLQAADILPVQALLHQQSVELLQPSLCLVQTVQHIIHSEICVTSKDFSQAMRAIGASKRVKGR